MLQFSRGCINGTVLHSEEAQVKCPYVDDDGGCDEFISEREIRKVRRPSFYSI